MPLLGSGNTGIPSVAGRCGGVVAHHEDSVAFVVGLEVDARTLVLDPNNVEVLHAQPARLIGSAT